MLEHPDYDELSARVEAAARDVTTTVSLAGALQSAASESGEEALEVLLWAFAENDYLGDTYVVFVP